MAEASEHNLATPPIGALPRSGGDATPWVCNEVWGGNRAFHGPIELPGIRGMLYSQPCDGAYGGDVHYLSVCGSGLLSRVCLADVTGHGASVSAVGQAMHDLLRRSVNRLDERRVLRRLNLRLAQLADRPFTTAAALSYFPPTHRLSISYAGHEPAWYFTAAEQRWVRMEPIQRRGLFDIVLAVEPRTRYTQTLQKVAIGDRLLMITDGVLEAPSPSGELFGYERLGRALQAACTREPSGMIEALIDELRDHTNGAPLHHDDVSLLLIEFVDNLASSALWTMLQNRLFRRRPRRDHANG